jgi:hypothetical protein
MKAWLFSHGFFYCQASSEKVWETFSSGFDLKDFHSEWIPTKKSQNKS